MFAKENMAGIQIFIGFKINVDYRVEHLFVYWLVGNIPASHRVEPRSQLRHYELFISIYSFQKVMGVWVLGFKNKQDLELLANPQRSWENPCPCFSHYLISEVLAFLKPFRAIPAVHLYGMAASYRDGSLMFSTFSFCQNPSYSCFLERIIAWLSDCLALLKRVAGI